MKTKNFKIKSFLFNIQKRFWVVLFICISCDFSGYSQSLQLKYSDNNETIRTAISKANEILAMPQFYDHIDSLPRFDNTTYTGRQIVTEMKSVKIIEVIEYYKRCTRTTAKTGEKISINTAKLERSLASIVNTLIHEAVHAVDLKINNHWDYTHRTQRVENPPISAPYIIGDYAESLVQLE